MESWENSSAFNCEKCSLAIWFCFSFFFFLKCQIFWRHFLLLPLLRIFFFPWLKDTKLISMSGKCMEKPSLMFPFTFCLKKWEFLMERKKKFSNNITDNKSTKKRKLYFNFLVKYAHTKWCTHHLWSCYTTKHAHHKKHTNIKLFECQNAKKRKPKRVECNNFQFECMFVFIKPNKIVGGFCFFKHFFYFSLSSLSRLRPFFLQLMH